MITLLNRFDDNYVIRKEDVLNLAAEYIKNDNLSSLVSDVVITDEDRSTYDSDNQLVKFNIKEISEANQRLFEQLQKEYDIDGKYTSYYLNFYYLKHIYKVLVNISQKAKYEGKEDIRGYLYDLCQSVSMDDKSRLLLPMEKEASNFGLLKAYNYLSYTKLPSKEAERMHLEYFKEVLLNYNRRNNYQVTSPIEVLNEMFPIIDMDELNRLLDESKLIKEERFHLGLPVTTKEYDSIQGEVNKRLVKTKK